VEVVLACGLAERLRRKTDEDGGEGLERLRRLCRAARHYERRAARPTLAEFIGQATLSADPDDGDGDVRVTLATLHAARAPSGTTCGSSGSARECSPTSRRCAPASSRRSGGSPTWG
jgi:hypothetical protein